MRLQGIRAFGGEQVLGQYKKEGDYFLIEMKGPDEVPKLISDLVSQGVQIREVREMQNPLEEFFQ